MADFFAWDPSTLSVHVPEMDSEHKTLIHKMNSLHAAFMAHSPKEKVEPLLNDFVSYVVKHFADEEEYMKKCNFEGLEIHKIIHQQLLKQAQTHLDDFKTTGKLTDGLFKFLANWLTSHIRGIDVKYGQKH